MPKFSLNRYMGLAILAWGGGMIYNLPYIRYYFYEPLRAALGLNHEQFGWTMSAYGVLAMLTYFPGGWLADRFSPRKLLSLAYASTALMGLIFSTFPGYLMSAFIHAFWGISTTLIFWAAMMKACKDMAGSEEQGRFFGLLECGRGVLTTISSLLCVAIYNKLDKSGDPLAGVRLSILFQSALTFIAAILTWCFFKDPPSTRSERSSLVSDIVNTIKLPMVWAAAFMVFFCYGAKIFATYANPFMTNVFGMSVALAGTLAVIWNWGCQFLGGPIGGFIADKIGHRPKVLCICYAFMTLFLLPMALTPGQAQYIILVGVSATAVFLSVYAIRGLYFAVVEDLNIPPQISGSAIGFMSLLGFTPDVFIYPLAGKILDSHPPLEGYRMLFWIAIAFGVCGIVVAAIVTAKVNRFRAARAV